LSAYWPEVSCWRYSDRLAELLRRPLRRISWSRLTDRNGRNAERPVLRAMAIRRDVVWPKNEPAAREGAGGEVAVASGPSRVV
jgi:hypothetical protein